MNETRDWEDETTSWTHSCGNEMPNNPNEPIDMTPAQTYEEFLKATEKALAGKDKDKLIETILSETRHLREFEMSLGDRQCEIENLTRALEEIRDIPERETFGLGTAKSIAKEELRKFRERRMARLLTRGEI